MKVGDYVRTKYGEICKLKKSRFKDLIYETDIEIDRYNDRDSNDYGFDSNTIQDIIKSSPNILELLEEHDFITIEYYSLRYDERVTRIFEVDYKDKEFMTLKNAYCDFMLKNNEFNDNDKALDPIVKSIVTSEQFSQMEYRIGE